MGDQRVAESDLVPGKYEGGWRGAGAGGRVGVRQVRGRGLGGLAMGGYRAFAGYGVVDSAVVCYLLWVRDGKRVKVAAVAV